MMEVLSPSFAALLAVTSGACGRRAPDASRPPVAISVDPAPIHVTPAPASVAPAVGSEGGLPLKRCPPKIALPGRSDCEAVVAAAGNRPGDLLDCVATPGGAWALEETARRAVPCKGQAPGDPAGQDTDWQLVHVSRDGQRAIGRRGRSTDDCIGLAGGSKSSVSLIGGFDYDGDGEPEAFLLQESESHVGQYEHDVSIFRFAGGKVQPFGPGAQALDDVDCDGIPDLMVPSRCPCRNAMGQDETWCPDLFQAIHALPGGLFSRDDAVARASVPACGPEPPPSP
jgi:hypothetical protein